MSNYSTYNHLGIRMENATFARSFPVGALLTATKEHWFFFRDILKETGQSASGRGTKGEDYLVLGHWSDIGEYGVTCLRVRDNRKISINSSWCNAAFDVSRPE